MECKKCGKEIDELNIYCDECKQILKKEQELEKLIDENKKLNELEITKEVENLNNFKDINKEDEESLKDSLTDIVKIDEDFKIDNDNNKKVIIIISIIFIILISLTLVFIFLFNKKEKEIKVEEKINYEEILNTYGDEVKLSLTNYLKENEDLPSWSVISDLITYNKHEIVCNIHELYKDSNIYLNECKIDGKKVKYSYGEKQDLIEGKTINIYEKDSTYNNKEMGILVGTITCETENCDYINAYKKYVLIKENNSFYIYNYEDNNIEFGPFNIENNYEDIILEYENVLYGVLYKEETKQNVYNVKTKKILKDIKGDLFTAINNLNTRLMYKYGYVIFFNDDKYNFINLKSGNVSYSIEGNLSAFIEDNNKKLVYILTHNSLDSKITIYNSNGKKLFDGKEFNNMRLVNNELIVTSDTNYYIYDSNLKLKLSSKEYENILALYDDYVVVVDNGNLKLVTLNDEELATYDLKWDNTLYKYDNILSGKVLENGEEVIYLIIERSNSSLKYYYNINTKEFGLK